MRAVHPPGEAPGDDAAWSCQTTALFEATEPLHWSDVRQYVRDVTSGNHSAWHMAKLLLRAGYLEFLRGSPSAIGSSTASTTWSSEWPVGGPCRSRTGMSPTGPRPPSERLDLQPGELVEVKSVEEITRTITPNGFNRGMRYDIEMTKYSGGRYRVQHARESTDQRADRQDAGDEEPVHSARGRLLPCGVYARRLGCPRAMNTYWREIWLRRVLQ